MLKKAAGICLFMAAAWAFTEFMVRATRDPMTPSREGMEILFETLPTRREDSSIRAPKWVDNGGPVGFYQAFRTNTSLEEVVGFYSIEYPRSGWEAAGSTYWNGYNTRELKFCRGGYSVTLTLRGPPPVSYSVQLFWTRDRGSSHYCSGKPP